MPLLATAVFSERSAADARWGAAWVFAACSLLTPSLPEGMFRKMPMRRGPGDPRLAIESSPTLSVGKYVAHRIRHAYGMRADRLRFLVILRNPTLRAFSYFKFAKRADRARMWFHQKFANLSFLQMVRQQILILRDHRGDCKWMNCAGDFELKGSSLAKLQTTMQDYHMVGMLTWGNYYPHLKNYMDGLDSVRDAALPVHRCLSAVSGPGSASATSDLSLTRPCLKLTRTWYTVVHPAQTQFYIIDSRKFESDWYNEMVNIFNHYGLDPALANMSSAVSTRTASCRQTLSSTVSRRTPPCLHPRQPLSLIFCPLACACCAISRAVSRARSLDWRQNHEGYIANAAPDLLIHPDRAPTVAEEKQHARGSAEWMAENKIDAELAMAFNLLDEYYQPFNEKLYDLFEQTKIPFRRWGTWQDDYKAHLATKPSDTTIVSKRIIVGK